MTYMTYIASANNKPYLFEWDHELPRQLSEQLPKKPQTPPSERSVKHLDSCAIWRKNQGSGVIHELFLIAATVFIVATTGTSRLPVITAGSEKKRTILSLRVVSEGQSWTKTKQDLNLGGPTFRSCFVSILRRNFACTGLFGWHGLQRSVGDGFGARAALLRRSRGTFSNLRFVDRS